MLESDEAARRLGVKVATLYAYVSRGQLTSYPGPSGRRRLFDMEEVERLARRSRQGKTVETRMVTIITGITQLTDGGHLYRGRPATGLATTLAFEEVAELLWEVDPGPDDRPVPSGGWAGSGDGWSPWPLGPPPEIGSWDRLTWAVLMAGARDPIRADLRPEAVTRTARTGGGLHGRRPGPRRGRTGRCGWPRPVGAGRWHGGRRLHGRSTGGAAQPGSYRRAGAGGQRGHGAAGRPRAGHLDGGRPGGRLDPGRPLPLTAGRPGHAVGTAARGSQPAGLLPPGGGGAPRRRPGPWTTPCDGRASCPASATRCTSRAMPGSPS